MRIINSNLLKKMIFSLFILYIGLSLGHSNIKTSYSYHKSINSDAYIYLDIAEHGFSGITQDHRSTRIFIPIAAYYISKANPFEGKYNSPQLNIFIVALLIFYITTLTLFNFVYKKFNLNIALLTITFFFLHFTSINQYFFGLPDTLEFLLSLLLFIILSNNKLFFLIPLFIVAALNRESFILFAIPTLIIWPFLSKTDTSKKVYWLYAIACSFIFMAIIFFLKDYLQDSTATYSAKILGLFMLKKIQIFFSVDQIRNLFYSILLLIPFGLVGLYKYKNFFYSAIIILLIYIFMGIFLIGSGAAVGRYIYSSTGPILLIGQAIFFANLIQNLNNRKIR